MTRALRLLAAALLVGAGAVAPVAAPGNPDSVAASRDPGSAEAPSGWRSGLEASLRESEYAITTQPRSVIPDHPGGLHAANRAQDLRAYFGADGIDLVRRTEEVPTWVLRLVPAEAPGEAAAPALAASGREVRVRRGARLERWENQERGVVGRLEFPWPAGEPEATLVLRAETGLEAIASGDGGVAFGRDGAPLVRILLLRALDGQGRDAAARLDVDGGLLRIRCVRAAPLAGAALTAGGSLEAAATGLPDDLVPPAAEPPDAGGARVEILIAGPEATAEANGIPTQAAWTARANQPLAAFGFAVAPAGDVDGDGYGDILVGARDFDGGQVDEGKAFLYRGGPAGPALTASWTVEGNRAYASLGFSVAGAGDVNGDGYDDLLVGAPRYNNGEYEEGSASLHLGSAAGPAATPAWSAEGNQAGAWLGYSVASAGDVNGDGFDDVIAGAYHFQNGETREGRALVYLGSAAGLSPAAAWSAEGNQPDAEFGRSVAGAGDVDGDGFDDLLVGAPYYDSGQTNEGVAFLFRGGPSGPASTSSWNAQGNSSSAQFGHAVAPAGDVNGDGYADVIVGALYYLDSSGTGGGEAVVYLGSAAGLGSVPAWQRLGGQGGAQLGNSVSSAGDANGDGYADILVAAHAFDNGQSNEGKVWLFLGGGRGPSSTPAWSVEGGAANLLFGGSVSSAGDVNGDGYSDLLIGAVPAYGSNGNEGVASVYLGGSIGPADAPAWDAAGGQAGASLGVSLASAGDVNADGFSDLVVGAYLYDNGEIDEGQARLYLGSAAGLEPSPAWTAEGNQPGARLGYSAAGAGDVNGDGYSDLVVGAYFASNGEANEGIVRLYAGSALGPGPAPFWTAEGGQAGAGFGIAVAGAGDVNADGIGDLLIGAHRYDNGETDEGAAFLYLGSPDGPGEVPDWAAEGNQAGARFGFSLGSAGDVNADGFSDVVVGAYLRDNGESDEGGAWIYRGSSLGLEPAPAWSAEGDQAGAYFGYAVGTAGDVNGDGYSDVVVGAIGRDGAASDEGAAFLYYGAPGRPAASPGWILAGDQAGAWLGSAVAAAGDVNADGYGELLIGARLRTQNLSDEGRASLFLGSKFGPGPIADWTRDGGQAGAYLGFSVAGAGDVNGDGFADIAAGALGRDEVATDAGQALVFLGNGGDGIDRVPRQLRPGGAPLAPLASTGPDLAILLGARVCASMGPVEARLEWEIEPLRVPFDGLGTGLSPDSALAGAPGGACAAASLDALVADLAPGYPYHWRLRSVRAANGAPLGPWIGPSFNSPGEMDLRTPGCADGDGDGFIAFPSPSCPPGAAADCLDSDPSVFPGAAEVCDGVATDCLLPDWPVPPLEERDVDGDGLGLCQGDCDDGDGANFPGNREICDFRDNDCDGEIDEGFAGIPELCNAGDDDCDGAVDEGNPGGGDACNTGQQGVCAAGATQCVGGSLRCERLVAPSPEACNNLDDDCDGMIDTFATSCGIGACVATGGCVGGVDSCLPPDPDAEERCNGLDDNCDGLVPADEADLDGDGYRACSGDCEDHNAFQYPGGFEFCDNLDNDCDGVVDGFPVVCGVGSCQGPGVCEAGRILCGPEGLPGPEQCNGLDDDCDGALPPEERDDDGDGFAYCNGDCDPENASTHPGAREVHDGRDNQCPGEPGAGSVDEMTGELGFTAPSDPTALCWERQGSALEYEAARSSRPDRAADCVAIRTTATCWSEAAAPPAGAVFYYLVRASASGAGSWGQDSAGNERRGRCGGEQECGDGIDNDTDGLVDCADAFDCFAGASCPAATFSFTDSPQDDIVPMALNAFLGSVPVAAGDHLRLSLSGAGVETFEWCSAAAAFYRSAYLALAVYAGSAASGASPVWYRQGGGEWAGPLLDDYVNYFGASCLGQWSWCSEINLGDRSTVIDPGNAGECEAWDLVYGCGSRGFTVTLTIGVDRPSACGF